MRSPALLTVVAFVSLLSGCGSNPSKNVAPALNGNWAIKAVSQTTGTTYLAGADLYTTAGKITGLLHFLNMPCGFTINGIMYDTPVTGTLSPNGNLQLSTPDMNGLTLKMTATWSSGVISSGTYTVSGQCMYEMNGDHGTLTGFPVAALNGTYTGSFVSASGVPIRATMSLSQLGPSNGIYSLKGTATFTGSPCFTTGTIDMNAYDFLVGSSVQFPLVTSNGSVLFQGQVTDATANTINGQYVVSGGDCSGDTGSGSATRK
jgi:hypothetical protein